MTKVPVLPIRGVVVFPNTLTPFVVGRASSVAALQEAEAGNKELLLLAQRDPLVTDPSPADLFRVGTVARVRQTLKLPDGNIKLLAEGVVRAKVTSLSHEGGSFHAEIETFDGELPDDPEVDRVVERVVTRLSQLPATKKGWTIDSSNTNQLADQVAAFTPLGFEEKQALLEVVDPVERLTRVAAILDGEFEEMSVQDGSLEMLRHTVATLAYRGGKAMRGAPAEFGEYRSAPDSRTPGEILAHMGDLFDWALKMCDGRREWHDSTALPWEQGMARFFAALEAFDKRLMSGVPLGYPAAKIFQGPIADALTHVGQIAMLRRMAGCKMRGENYFAADIEVGRVGADQAAPVQEFE